MALSISLKDNATPYLQDLMQRVTPQALAVVAGAAAVETFRNHFQELESSRPNKIGGKRTHFWSQARHATHAQIVQDGVVISVNQVGVRQRYQGGTIKPVNARMLTIPAAPEAYGKRAGEFDNLRFALIGGHPALVETDATKIRIGKKGVKNLGQTGGKVMYWLARSVEQKGDESVLPTKEQIVRDITEAVDGYIDRRKKP